MNNSQNLHVTATFIGDDGTKGYQRFKRYPLQLQKLPTESGVQVNIIHSPTQKVRVEYLSEAAFQADWEDIKETKLV